MNHAFKALSDPTRRRVLLLLRERPMSAGELSDQFDVSKPTMSAHFAVLKEADLVHAEKTGKSIIYHLKLSVLEEALLGFAHSFGLGAQAPAPQDERGVGAMRQAAKKELIPALSWVVMLLTAAFAAAYAYRQGYIDANTKVRLIALNGLWLAWYGNRIPKAFVPSVCVGQAKRVVGWSMVLSGLVYGGVFAFAPITVALRVGTIAGLAGMAVSIGYCLSLRATPKAG